MICEGVKYELQLDNTDKKKVIMPPPKRLSEDECMAFQHSLSVRWILVGWTECSEDQLRNELEGIIESFGEYDMLTNNCRVFLARTVPKMLTKVVSHPLWLMLIQVKKRGFFIP